MRVDFYPLYKPLLSELAGVRFRHLILPYPGGRDKRKNRDSLPHLQAGSLLIIPFVLGGRS
jgi:hypothetical protein